MYCPPWRRCTLIHREYPRLSLNCLHATGIQSFSSSFCDELILQPLNAVGAFQTIKAVAAMRHDEVKASAQAPGDSGGIRWWCYRIPLSGEDQNRHARLNGLSVAIWY